MSLEIGNAYSFKLDETRFGGLFIADIYQEYRGAFNLTLVGVDFELKNAPQLKDFLHANTIQIKTNTLELEDDHHVEIKAYNMWKHVFVGLNILTYVGRLPLRPFETLSSPIRTQNAEDHLKKEFLSFSDTVRNVKKMKDSRYHILPIRKLIHSESKF